MEFHVTSLSKFFALASLCLSALCMQGQYFHPKNIDVGASVFWQYTTTLATDGQVGGGGINHQYTTNPVGFVLQFRDSPKPLLGFEVNYAYAHPTESYNYYSNATPYSLTVPTGQSEVTLAYLARPHIPLLHPFFAIGGGFVGFTPDNSGTPVVGSSTPLSTQWRGAGVAELGVDLQFHEHLGVRIQGRFVGTRSPNFHALVISTDAWTISSEPTFGAYYRF